MSLTEEQLTPFGEIIRPLYGERKPKSRSKTFQKGECFANVMDHICDIVETEDTEYPAVTATLDPPEVITELKHKYIITVTKIE